MMDFDLKDVLSSFDHIRGGIPVTRLSKRVRLGQHRSVFFGPSYDFFDIQEYDEERDSPSQIIDSLYDPDEDIIWARKTIEEHQDSIRFIVDLSSSAVDSGTDFTNRRMLLEAVGLIGISGARYGDQVGLNGFTEKIVLNVPSRGGVNNFVYLLWVLYDFLDKQKVENREFKARGTDFAVMLDFIKRINKSSFVPVFSDFVGFDSALESRPFLQLLQHVAVKHELLFVFLDNPSEITSIKGRGSLRVEDIETGEQVIVSRNKTKIDEIAQEARWQRTILRKQKLRKIGIDSVVLEPGKHITRLEKFFEKRRKFFRT